MTPEPRPLLDPAAVAQLRQALSGAGYTGSGVAARLGPAATTASGRGDHRRALRATAGDDDPQAVLIRLFTAGRTEPAGAVAAALAPLPLAHARAAGLVVPDGTGLRRGVDLAPYGDGQWVVSDVADVADGSGHVPLAGDYVPGVGSASTTLADATVRHPVASALDLGTGCGVQALHLCAHARAVTATDVSPRALRYAATTAALSGQRLELRHGDLDTPVTGRRFDLVVSNPPFAVGPPDVATHTYRDSGRDGDAVCAHLAGAAPALLAEGGVMQYLANWAHVAGQDWRERVAGWFAGTGCDAWVLQRDVSDPLSYVRMWLDDANQAGDRRRHDAWLDWLEARQVEGIGFGLVTVRRSGHDDPLVRVEELPQRVEPPLGARVAQWLDRTGWLRGRGPEALLDARYRAADGSLHEESVRGDEGWRPRRRWLELAGGARWREEVDPLVAALVAGADGRMRMREQVAVLAAAHGAREAELAGPVAAVVAHLVERGMLLPEEEPATVGRDTG